MLEKKKEDVVKYIECRSSKIKTNNLHSQFNTMVIIGDLDKSSFSEKWERVKSDYRGSRSNGNGACFQETLP